jgi:hypothetical protein
MARTRALLVGLSILTTRRSAGAESCGDPFVTMMQAADLRDVNPDRVFGSHNTIEEKIRSV